MKTTIAHASTTQKDELLLALFDSSLYGIMVLKSVEDEAHNITDFEFIAVNATTEAVLGRTVPKGTRFTDVFIRAKESGILQTYTDVAKRKETLSFESLYPYHEGINASRWYKQKVAAHTDGIVVAFEDLTSQKVTEHELMETREHFEETEYKYLTLFNSMDQGMCIINVLFDESQRPYDFRILEMNPAFAKNNGLSESSAGKTYHELGYTDGAKLIEVYGDVAQSGNPTRFEHQNKDVWYEVHAMPMEEGTNKVAVYFYDITERRKAEKKAEQDRKNAMRALKYKQMFLSNMSHEIRTPLTAIIGFTEEILKHKVSDKLTEYVNAIKVSGDAILVLVNDILDLAKVDEGKMEFEEHPFHLDACIRNMLLLFETKFEQKGLSVVKEYDPTIPSVLLGDSTRLNQIILNLVSNAVKFTHEGEITIIAKAVEQDRETITIELFVKDTGIGIEEEELQHIFDTFRQASNKLSKIYGGTGLGLSIVKQLVEAQGGTITVKSQIGVGSIFCVTLTFKKPQNERDMEIHEGNKETKGNLRSETEYRILVAEDVKLNQLLLQVILSNMGFKVDIVPNGKEAVECIKNNTYDLILMDIQMPIMNGFEATKYIRTVLHNITPIIALTADVATADIEKFLESGMNGYETKPIKQTNLYNTIMEVLEGSNKLNA